MAAIGVLIAVQVWTARGALFGVVAIFTYTAIGFSDLLPPVKRTMERMPGPLLLAGMAFVISGWWFGWSLEACLLFAVASAASISIIGMFVRRRIT